MGYKKSYSEINTVGKNDFIRLLADETGFTLKTTRQFWEATEVVIARVLESEMELNLGGFGKFYVTDFVAKHTIEETKSDKPNKRKRIGFRPSKVFKKITK